MKFRENRRQRPVPEEIPQNDYYETVSEKLGIFQVVLYLSLLLFVVLSFLGNTNLITYQNLYYFFKDLGASADTVDVWNTDSVTYQASAEQSFVLYRKGLAVAGNDTVTIFTATGRQTVGKAVSYSNPTAVGTGKYLLVYELGGTHYSLYNSYTQLYAGETERPLTGAAVSDSGVYALITSSAEYPSVVYLYNSNFHLINEYDKTGYVMDVSINEKGTLAVIATAKANGAGFADELMFCVPGEKTARAVCTVGNAIPLSCSFTDADTVALLTGDTLYFVGVDGDLQSFYRYDGEKLLLADAGRNGVTLVLSDGEKKTREHVIVFDKSGGMLYNDFTKDALTGTVRSGNTVYLVTLNGVTRLDALTGTTDFYACDTAQKTVLAFSEDEILLCAPQKAVYLRFSR